MKKYFIFCLVSVVSGCGAIHTQNDTVDAIYNTTSAVIQNRDAAQNCEQGHPDDRAKCLEKQNAQSSAISNAIKKHQENGV